MIGGIADVKKSDIAVSPSSFTVHGDRLLKSKLPNYNSCHNPHYDIMHQAIQAESV